MGSVGTTKSQAYSDDFQYYIDNAGGDEKLALLNWVGDNVSSTFTKNGKEYEIQWQNGVFPHIVSEATTDDPYTRFTLEIYARREDKPDDISKPMYVTDYGRGKGRQTFSVRVYK